MNLERQWFIPGPAGQLEAITTSPKEQKKPIVGIVCHPNPTQEGTMRNKVVTTITRAFEQLGLTTVRFNYRGVGKSSGSYGEVVGEINDLKAVIAWVQQQWPDYRLWLAGFSFGTFIASSVENEMNIAERLISVAPAVNWHDFTHLTNIQSPWLVICSDSDEVVPFEATKPWLEHPPSPMEVEIIHGASHFFHGRLIELRELLRKKLAC